MNEKIKILHLEDEPADAGLIARELKKGKINCELLVVDTKAKFITALNDFAPDLILCDNSIPSFNAHQTLALVKEMGVNVPFILVTATMTEEYAVEVMREGANDYLFKDRLQRLPEAVTAALEKGQLKKKQHESEQLFRALIETGADMITLSNIDGKMLYGSPSISKTLGYSTKELLHMRIFDVLHPDDLPAFLAKRNVAVQNHNNSFHHQMRILHKKGNWIWCEGTFKNMLDEPGVHALVSNFREITERKKSEEAIRASELRYRRLFESAKDGILILNADAGVIIDVNPFMIEMLGYSHEEFLGKQLWEIGLFKDIVANKEAFLKLKEEGYIRYNDLPLKTKDGSAIWVEFVSNVYGVNGQRVVQCNIRNITEKKIAEEQKEYDKNNTNALINNTNDLMWSVDRDFNLITSNIPFDEMSKMHFGRIIKKGENVLSAAYTPEMLSHFKKQYERAFADEVFTEIEHFTVPFEFWTEISYYPIRKGDEVIGTACHSRDITSIKKAEEKLSQLNSRLQLATNSAGIGIFDWDIIKNILVWDKNMYTIFRVAEGQFGGAYEAWANTIHPEDKEQAFAELNAAVEGSKDFHTFFRIVWPEGEIRYVEGHAIVLRDAAGKAYRMIGVNRDITEQKRSEKNLKTSLQEISDYKYALDESSIVAITNQKGIITFVNDNFCTISKFSREELIGQDHRIINSGYHTKEFIADLWKTIATGKLWRGEIKNKAKDGTYYWVDTTIVPFLNEDGKPIQYIAIRTDITNEKETKEILVESEKNLREAQAIAHLGSWEIDFASGVALWSEESCRIFGLSTDDNKQTYQIWKSFIHPDDLDEVLKTTEESQKTLSDAILNHRILLKDGTVKHIHSISKYKFDKSGKPVGLYGISHDITGSKLVELELAATLLALEGRVITRTKELSEKNKNITDSINYAKRIQIGLLTPYSQLTELFPTSFILSEPQNIVSGDFFWCHQKNNKKFVVVADCTGHGVPGALMSIIGNNLLNGIIVDEHIDNPSEILLMLDQRLKEAVKGDRGEIKDGMDIALCVIDTYFKEVYFAGAYRPLFVSDENGKINELIGNSFSVGGGMDEIDKKFETKRFSIIPGQRIYLTSDGYYSQFGGPLGKKFMKKYFRETLEELQAYPVVEQKNKLKQLLTEWAGKNERVDDVMVVGIEL